MVTMSPTRVLAVSSELPWPLDTGGHLRTFHLLRYLARDLGEVRLVVPCPPGVDVRGAAAAGLDVRPVPVPRRTTMGEARRAATGLLRREPYVFYRRHAWPQVEQALAEHLTDWRPDLLYLDHLDSFVYAPLAGALPLVLDLHNVYSRLVARSADEHRHAGARWLLRGEAGRVHRMEQRAVAAAALTLTVSEDDAAALAPRARRVAVVPNGVDCRSYAALPTGRAASPTPRLLYVGALSWPPNVAAARTLATEVLPQVQRRHPGARVDIVGRRPTPEVVALGTQAGVEVHGDVADVSPFLARASALVVPLEAGGGTRLKILEAFAAGLPVVSTPVGCEGLDVRHDEHLLVAGRAGLADATARLLESPALGESLAQRARALAARDYDWGAVGRRAADAIRSMRPSEQGREQSSALV
jgi:glycosyltransferase involved in cell wall biosynthesis